MKHITDYIKTHKYCLFLLYWPVHTLWYEILRIAYAEKDVLLIRCALDDRIPFCEWFVIPYCIWYLYIAAVLLYTLIHSKRDFIRTTALMCLCMILPMLFCTFVPNGIPADMRPDFEALGRNNPAIWAVKRIYAADTPPRSCMPSMHVSVAFAIFFSVLRAESLRGRRAVKSICGVLSVLISLSTVFIKQHSVLDVAAGTATAAVVFAAVSLAECVYNKKQEKSA